jgi:hypothetical protein
MPRCDRSDARRVRLQPPGRPGIEWADLCQRHQDEAAEEGLLVAVPPPTVRVRTQEITVQYTGNPPDHLTPSPLLTLRQPLVDGLCRIADCTRQIDTRGLCNTHYKRARIAGLLGELALPPKTGPAASSRPPSPAALPPEVDRDREAAQLRARLSQAERERDESQAMMLEAVARQKRAEKDVDDLDAEFSHLRAGVARDRKSGV